MQLWVYVCICFTQSSKGNGKYAKYYCGFADLSIFA